MRTVIGIDPGPDKSAIVRIEDWRVVHADILPNCEVASELVYISHARMGSLIGIEKVQSYGMAVGKEVFETCFWIGEYRRVCKDNGLNYITLPRPEIKSKLCHSAKAKDANVRQALIDLLGPPGTKKKPGPTYGVKSHCWAALAVAVIADVTDRRVELDTVEIRVA